MMNKSVFIKAIMGLCATTCLVSAATYSLVRMDEPQIIDFTAFRNAAANIQYISNNNSKAPVLAVTDVTGSIVSTIEKEVKAKIIHTRYAIAATPKKVYKTPTAIAKNWNDIRPEFAAVNLSVKKELLNPITSSEAASEFEINNKELIYLHGFEADSLQFETFANTLIASSEEIKVVPETEVQTVIADDKINDINDEVNTAQAAPVEALTTEPEVAVANDEAAAEVATKENEVNDDLVVYDYSDKKAEAPKLKKIFDAPISNSVKEAIAREVHKSPVVAANIQKRNSSALIADNNELEKVMNDEDNLVFDYSQQTSAAVTKKDSVASAVSAFTAPPEDTTTQVEFAIKASEVNLTTQKVHPAYGFEFIPDYDRAERTDDQTSGEIKIGYSLAGDVSTQTGVVQSQGMIPTRVELNLLNKGMDIPLLNEEGIQKFLQKKGEDVVGNLLMVAVDPSIQDVEIDSESQFKLFFSSKFKLLESKDNAAYVLFLGVKSGNISLRYLLDNKETAQKIVYVGEGEMYFEDPDFVESQREQFTFNTRSLLGRKVKELNIEGSDIKFFGSNTEAKKKALNVYEIKIPELVDNSRKYLEFKHMGSSLFVGTTSTTEIEIPGKDFIGRVLQANDMSDIGERCLVQLNLSKDLRDMKVSGKNRTGEMFAETSFLDNDGNFSKDNSELAEKVFVTGDLEGIFNVRLDYTDGTTDFLKTFCSEGSYLIEQL